jgi:hypothetical protein
VRNSYLCADYMIGQLQYLVEHSRSFTPGHIVILCHDPMLEDEYAVRQLELFIEQLKIIPGWHFEHLQFYPGKQQSWVTNNGPLK